MFRVSVSNDGVETFIYNDTVVDDSLRLVNPKLSLAENSAGSFTFKVPPGNVGYNLLNRTTSVITVYKDTKPNEPYWEGRILQESEDFWKCKSYTCEGALAYLNDTLQPPNHYQGISESQFLSILLSIHNIKVDAKRQFALGDVTVHTTDTGHRYTNYENTMECISDKLIGSVGGHLEIRYDEHGTRYLDYKDVYHSENTQRIEFGRNLLDFSKNFSSEDFCTCLVPRGEQLEDGPYDALTNYLDVSSVNNGSVYVMLTNDDFDTPPAVLPVDEFGRIEQVHDWSDVTVPANLLRKAKQYLKDQQFDKMELTVSALDMRYAGANYEDIDLLDSVRVVSVPHGLDKVFPVTKLEIPLDQPENSKFTLGESVSSSLTSRNTKTTGDIKKQIAEIPTEQKLTKHFREEAADMINHATTGYINIITDENTGAMEFVVSDTPNYEEATEVWRWNINGLAHSSHGYESEDYDVALTADGRINASMISVGDLVADIIRAGILKDQVDGTHFWLNLETGEVRLKAVDDLITEVGSVSSRVDINSQDISTAVERVTQLDGEIEQRAKSVFDQNSESIVIQLQNYVQNTTGQTVSNVNTYFEFSNAGLKIKGTAGSAAGSYLQLASDEVTLYANNSRRLWLNQNGANADSFNARQSVSIGEQYVYLWESYSGGIRLIKK